MTHQPLEDLLPKSNWSIYALARMAANRAIELAEGKPRLLDKVSSDKETTIALEEIVKGKVMTKAASDRMFGKDKNIKN